MDDKHFAIVPPGKSVLLVPVLAATAAMVAVGISLTAQANTPLPWPAYLAFAAVPLLATLLAVDMFRREVRVTDKGLRLRALPWPTTVPFAELELERAELVDLTARTELMPRIKIAGARLPGYRAGVFRLRDKRRASVLLTDLRRVVLLPRRDGSLLLLSVEQPEAFLQALRRRG